MKIDFTQSSRPAPTPAHRSGAIRVAMVLFAYLLVSAQAMAQTLTVTGRVTDAETNAGLPGVTVLLKGTTTAAPTGADGTYTINVPDGTGTLVFTYIGYENAGSAYQQPLYH